MSEMSLTQQIELVEEMKQFIRQIANETQKMMDDVNSIVIYLRQEGLPSEIADRFCDSLYMGQVNKDLDKLLDRITREDYSYLDGIQQDMEDALRL